MSYRLNNKMAKKLLSKKKKHPVKLLSKKGITVTPANIDEHLDRAKEVLAQEGKGDPHIEWHPENAMGVTPIQRGEGAGIVTQSFENAPTKILGHDGSKQLKNLEREAFAQFYATSEEFFGNGVRSYAAAYGTDISTKKGFQVAGSNANRLLKTAEVMSRISYLVNLYLSDAFVDKNLAFVIAQFGNLNAKMEGVKEYNRLRKRIQDKMIAAGVINVNLTPDQSRRIAERVIKRVRAEVK